MLPINTILPCELVVCVAYGVGLYLLLALLCLCVDCSD